MLLDVLDTDADEVPDIVEAQCEKEKLYEKLRHLGRRERKVIELRYGRLCRLEEVAVITRVNPVTGNCFLHFLIQLFYIVATEF